MKSNLLKTVFDWVLVTSLLLSVLFFVQFFNRTRSLRTMQMSLQAELAQFQNTRTFLNMVVGDVMEYSKSHPDIDPILESINAKPGKNNPKPAGK
jgi:hypothetical protein